MNATEALARVHELTQKMPLKAKHHFFISQVFEGVAKDLQELDALRAEKKKTGEAPKKERANART
jgi:hypothetical protein